MLKLAILALAMTLTACAVDPQDTQPEPQTSSTEQSIEAVAHEAMLVFERKGLFQTWQDFCEDLEGMEVRFTDANGCTTSRSYTNCHRGAISGTCKCDEVVTRSGGAGC